MLWARIEDRSLKELFLTIIYILLLNPGSQNVKKKVCTTILGSLKLPGVQWSHCVVSNSCSSRCCTLQKVAHKDRNSTLVFFQCSLMDSQEKPREGAYNTLSHFGHIDTVTQLDHTQACFVLIWWIYSSGPEGCWTGPLWHRGGPAGVQLMAQFFHFKEEINGCCGDSCGDQRDQQNSV